MKLLIVLFLLYSISFAQSAHLNELSSKAEILSYLFEGHASKKIDVILFHQIDNLLEKYDLNQIEKILVDSIEIELTQGKNFKGLILTDIDSKQALQYLSNEDIVMTDHVHFSSQAQKIINKVKHDLMNVEKNNLTSVSQIQSLISSDNLLEFYKDGDYQGGISLFLFCRKDRYYPCLFVMKNKWGDLVREENGRLWTLPALAKSAGDKPFYQTNGQTPTGIHSIDSVMPIANHQELFGHFRRLILNWIPVRQKRELALDLLPLDHHQGQWWRAASLARDAGRTDLRIHGTGRVNKNKNSKYYPHVPTAGCISMREGKYGEITFKDQRAILDKLIEASALLPSHVSEQSIKGILYVINLDIKKRAVTLDDLNAIGLN